MSHFAMLVSSSISADEDCLVQSKVQFQELQLHYDGLCSPKNKHLRFFESINLIPLGLLLVPKCVRFRN